MRARSAPEHRYVSKILRTGWSDDSNRNIALHDTGQGNGLSHTVRCVPCVTCCSDCSFYVYIVRFCDLSSAQRVSGPHGTLWMLTPVWMLCVQVLDKAVVKKHAVVAPGAVVTPGKVVPTGQVRHRPRRVCRRMQHPMGDSK